jgi:uncharacterized protein (TIGR03437 family)
VGKRIGLLLFVTMTAFGLRGQTIDDFIAVCPTAQEISAIDKDLTLVFEGTDPSAAGGFVCRTADGSKDLTRMKERVYQAIRVFKAIKFDTPLPWTEKPIYDWLVSSIKGIKVNFDRRGGWCCNPGLTTIEIGIGPIDSNLWLDPNGSGIWGLLSVILHEARHANGDFPHACTGGDETMAMFGSYAAQLYWNEWLAEHTDAWFAPAPSSYDSVRDSLTYKRLGESAVLATRDQNFCNPGDSIAVVPSNRDFGSIAVESATARIVTATQTSNTPIVVSRVSIEGNDAGDFEIAKDGCSGKTMDAQGWFTDFSTSISCIVTVKFAPHSEGAKTADLVVFDNAINNPHIVPLSGTGTKSLLTVSAVVGGASFVGGRISPREHITLFGQNLTDGTTSGDWVEPKFEMAGASVKICGIPSRMIYASPSQLNVVTPSSLTVGTKCDVVASSPFGTDTFSEAVPVVAQSPQLFMFIPTLKSTGGIFPIKMPVVMNAKWQMLGPPIADLNPELLQAKRGEVIVAWGTGCGVKYPDEHNTPAEGLLMPVMPKLTVGGIPARVDWAGLAPGFDALCQFNFEIPPNLPPGKPEVPVPLVLEKDGEKYSLYVR